MDDNAESKDQNVLAGWPSFCHDRCRGSLLHLFSNAGWHYAPVKLPL